MIVKIHNQANVNASGTKTSANCKPVYCITTGRIYASVADAAKDFDVNQSTVSRVIIGKTRTVKGNRLCYLSKVTEHFDEITECITKIHEKASHYDAIVAKQVAKQKAFDNLALRKQELDKAKIQLQKATQMFAEAQADAAQYEV